jgi:hypothetical protein
MVVNMCNFNYARSIGRIIVVWGWSKQKA